MDARDTIDGVDFSEPAPGRLLPPRAYTSPIVYQAEMERIFARSWVHVADRTELRAPGDFVAAQRSTRSHRLSVPRLTSAPRPLAWAISSRGAGLGVAAPRFHSFRTAWHRIDVTTYCVSVP